MQLFHPSFDLFSTANALWEDGRRGNRLNNQINEALIILRTNTGWYVMDNRTGWPNHPIVIMWQGHEAYLANYLETLLLVYEELSGNSINKRYRDMLDALEMLPKQYQMYKQGTFTVPDWLDEDFCLTHRELLISKFPNHYRRLYDNHNLQS